MLKTNLLVILVLSTAVAFSQTTQGWTTEYRENFIKFCAASAKSIGEDSANWYCSCMATKLEKIYPNSDDADKLKPEDMQKPEMMKLVRECLSMKWPQADRDKFMDDCVKSAAESAGQEKAKKYCNCMLAKVEAKYPTLKDADKLTSEELKKPEWRGKTAECISQ